MLVLVEVPRYKQIRQVLIQKRSCQKTICLLPQHRKYFPHTELRLNKAQEFIQNQKKAISLQDTIISEPVCGYGSINTE